MSPVAESQISDAAILGETTNEIVRQLSAIDTQRKSRRLLDTGLFVLITAVVIWVLVGAAYGRSEAVLATILLIVYPLALRAWYSTVESDRDDNPDIRLYVDSRDDVLTRARRIHDHMLCLHIVRLHQWRVQTERHQAFIRWFIAVAVVCYLYGVLRYLDVVRALVVHGPP